MKKNFTAQIARRSGAPELLAQLAERLSPSELNSLLLEVFHRQVQTLTPGQVLAAYRNNPLVQPSGVDSVGFREFECLWLKKASSAGFQSVELGPVSPLGSCSVFGAVHQNKVLSALRGAEVTADATNLRALESSRRRQEQGFPPNALHFSCAHRHLRTQRLTQPGFTPHFGVFCLSSAGRDTGNFYFEKEHLTRHLKFYLDLLHDDPAGARCTILLKSLDTPGQPNRLCEQLEVHLRRSFPGFPLEILHLDQSGHQYYRSVQFGLIWQYCDAQLPIVDGGFTDWTQALTSNRKERFLSSGIGLELLWKFRNGYFSN
ncbi:MAG: hypothetical protein JNK89_01875 [Saprospiraceae bacterium]|nr:hypothetical protein [Saprospiraceae bacterium]